MMFRLASISPNLASVRLRTLTKNRSIMPQKYSRVRFAIFADFIPVFGELSGIHPYLNIADVGYHVFTGHGFGESAGCVSWL